MSRGRTCAPCERVPVVAPGQPVRLRTAFGEWVEGVAASEPRYDRAAAIGPNCYLTVSVLVRPDRYDHPVNWPAEDVEPLDRPSAPVANQEKPRG